MIAGYLDRNRDMQNEWQRGCTIDTQFQMNWRLVNVTTCATDTTTNTVICSTENVLLVRGSGHQKFKDVTQQLTTIAGTTVGTVSLFQDGFTNFFWQYDNFGLKLAQIRFYPQ